MDHSEISRETKNVLPPGQRLEDIAKREIENRESAGEDIFADCVDFIQYHTSHVERRTKRVTDAFARLLIGENATDEEKEIAHNAYVYALAEAKSLLGPEATHGRLASATLKTREERREEITTDAKNFIEKNKYLHQRLIMPIVVALESETLTRSITETMMAFVFMSIEREMLEVPYIKSELAQYEQELGWDE